MAVLAALVPRHARLGAGEVLQILKDIAPALAAKAVQPVLDIGRITRLGLLPVIDDVEARRDLPLHHVDHRLPDPRIELRLLDGLAILAGEHERAQRLRARQAADMGGEKAPLAHTGTAGTMNPSGRAPGATKDVGNSMTIFLT